MSDLSTQLAQTTGWTIYEPSIQTGTDGVTYFMGRDDKGLKYIGSIGEGAVSGTVMGNIDEKNVIARECDPDNAGRIRKALPFTAPQCVGLATSAGLGDRLGLATPGHIRAMRQQGGNVRPFLAQQSIREMVRTGRDPWQVMNAATWGVLQEGYTDGFGSDADHLQKPEDIDLTCPVGFTMFTIDPGKHVVDEADSLSASDLEARFGQMDLARLETSAEDLKSRYDGQCFPLEGGEVRFDGDAFLRAVVKYGGAIAHTASMYRHLQSVAKGDFELEVSVDETESPTTPAEHYFFANELKRLGVEWVSMAPRFVGRMEKGVDYIGDLDIFREKFAEHVAVMRTLGPYKISIHSGSDKFSIYPICVELAGGHVHLKTAGTSYLEALRAIAKVEPSLFRDIYEFARARYETDKATYHVSADLAKVRPAEELSDEELAGVLDEFDARQVLHVTFGSVLTVEEGKTFRVPLMDVLRRNEETHYDVLAHHLGRHVAPLAGA